MLHGTFWAFALISWHFCGTSSLHFCLYLYGIICFCWYYVYFGFPSGLKWHTITKRTKNNNNNQCDYALCAGKRQAGDSNIFSTDFCYHLLLLLLLRLLRDRVTLPQQTITHSNTSVYLQWAPQTWLASQPEPGEWYAFPFRCSAFLLAFDFFCFACLSCA